MAHCYFLNNFIFEIIWLFSDGALSEGAHSRGEEYEQLHGNSTSQSGMPLPGMTASDILSHQVVSCHNQQTLGYVEWTDDWGSEMN